MKHGPHSVGILAGVMGTAWVAVSAPGLRWLWCVPLFALAFICYAHVVNDGSKG